MVQWSVAGSFLARRGVWQRFVKTHEAGSPEQAREWALSEIGGRPPVGRRFIRIEAVTQARP